MKKYLLVIILVFFSVLQLNAQRIEYENNSKFFWGLNVGHVWHTSDVDNIKGRFPLGAGVILGRSLNQDYGKLFSYDLRFRYLGGKWYGHDKDTTSAMHGNHAFYPAYDSMGYALKNFSSVQHSLDLELSFHYNRLKETSGIDPYIFAGLGIVGTRTKGDIFASQEMGVKDLDYTTLLDKNELGEPYEQDAFHTQILPSLGVGIGYFFNSRFSLGVEHRSTFFRGDYFDGTVVNKEGNPSNIKNDIYHYTSIYFKWYFKSKEYRESQRTPDRTIQDPTPSDVIDQTRKNPPRVRFTNPSSRETETNTPNYTIRASVKDVLSGSNLTFSQNGRNIPTFIYNPNTEVFESKVVLQPGENTFYLSGTNPYGSDSDETTVIYIEKPRVLPPIVNIVDPDKSPHTVNKLNYIVKASILNVRARNQLTVTFNDKPFQNFSFSENGSINFTTNLNLNAGVNTLNIHARNEAGTDSDETVIIYTRQPSAETGYPPIVKINTPAISPHRTSTEVEGVRASVQNVTNRQDIEVRVNGVSTSIFSFNTTTLEVGVNAPLIPGNNTVRIIASNAYGQDMDEVNIIYQKAAEHPPYVQITQPAIDPYHTTQNYEEIVATVKNVYKKQELEVKVNGTIVNDFYFNASLNTLQFNAQLEEGNNNISILANNEFGNSMDDRQIVYRKPVTGLPPTVYFTKPVANPYSTTYSTEEIIATTNNVDSKSQIEVKVNGQATQNFTFNANEKQIRLNTHLSAGSNIVSIKATNPYGSASDDRQIIYRQPTKGNPPLVNITKPTPNPFGTSNDSEEVLAKVEYITDQSQLEVRINGQKTTNFTFNPSTQEVRLVASLSEGSNVINIQASNTYGESSDEITVVYKKRVVTKNPPTVVITRPATSPYSTSISPENIKATTSHISNKSQIAVTVNGQATNDFNFSFITKTIEFSPHLISGTNVVKIVVTNNDGSDNAETYINYRKKEIQRPPLVSFISPSTPNTTVLKKSYEMKAKVENITQKSELQLYFNESLVNPSQYSFNTANNTVVYPSELNLGTNTFRINALNEDGAHQAETNIVFKTITIEEANVTVNEGFVKMPCDKKDYPSITYNSPMHMTTTVTSNHFKIDAHLHNIKDNNEISVSFNGLNRTGFNYHVASQTFSDDLVLQDGTNTYQIVLTNDCETIESELTFVYEPVNCGVEIDLFNDGELCLITPTGTFNKNHLLNNNNFEYDGPATDLYFKARENGVVKVNNQDFQVVKGNFYHFKGNSTVQIKRVDKKWSVCVESMRGPIYGIGRAKPINPCATQNKEPSKPVRDKRPVREPKKPVTNPDQRIETPTSAPATAPTRTPTRTAPTRTPTTRD